MQVMSWIYAVTLLAAIAAGSSQSVRCFSGIQCNSESVVISESSIEDCCRHGVRPFGVSYIEENQAQCLSCPVELGFVMTEFTGSERSNSYNVEIAIISGYVNETIVHVELHHGTTTNGDIELRDNSINISEVVPQEHLQTTSVELFFMLDTVAQEEDESFMLMLNCTDESFICRSTLSGTVIDNTAVTFEFSEDDYSTTEGQNSAIEVTVTKSLNISLAQPVTLTVVPLTVEEALRQDVNILLDADSQNRASSDDFSAASIQVDFIADVDRQSLIANLPVLIPITDDRIDEADRQIFVATLIISSAFNSSIIQISRNASVCTIFDDDALQIGFKKSQYSYIEPNEEIIISDVKLEKEGDIETELTYIINVKIDQRTPFGVNVATSSSDFLAFLGNETVTLQPSDQNVTIPLALLPDNLIEGIEGFRITSTYNFPAYSQPDTLFSSTLITITDNDYITVGFEESIYAVNESDNVEVCVQVSDNNALLEFEIILSYQSLPSTADGSDFSEVNPPHYISIEPSESGNAKTCFFVEVYDDAITEETESFLLELTFHSSEDSSIIMDYNTTEILILDNDSPGDLVNCFPTLNCVEEVGERATVEACCQHDTSPFGLSYSLVSGNNRCHLCPTEFGFIEEEVIGIEQAEEYTAHLKFFSGTLIRSSGLIINLTHSACDQDVEFPSIQVFIKPVRNNSSDVQVYPVSFTYKLDNVAQEENETFTVSIEANPSYLLHPKLRKMTGIIIDNDIISFQLSENDYRQTEGPNAVLVTRIIKLSTAILANSVTFTIQPLTVEEALNNATAQLEAQSIPSLYRADNSDFDNTTRRIVFTPDDGNSIDATVPINLDDVVEPDEEFFIIQLNVEDEGTINKDLIRIERSTGKGVIIDNRQTETIRCFSRVDCNPNSDTGLSFMGECCRHGVHPFGLAYIESLEGGCQQCPTEFGFVNSSLIANESTDTYQVGLAFFSGQSSRGSFVLPLFLTAGTADPENDIDFTDNRVVIPQVVEEDELAIVLVDILLRLDLIAQEDNETFSLTLADLNHLEGAILRSSLEGIIVDATTVTFEMTEEDYREREGDTGFMPVVITRSSEVSLTNPVTIIVFPWTVAQAEAEGLIPDVLDVPDSSPFSPNSADENDFNISSITIVIPADEGNAIVDFDVPIQVFDDSVDEANDQYFIAEFRIVSAVNISLIRLEQRASRCRIVDNDPIRIGFQLNQYDYFEPESGLAAISNIALIKEDNVESEQTFGISISFGDPGRVTINAATLQPVSGVGAFDYVVSAPGDNSLLLLFSPHESEVTFSFTLFADALLEGTEGFRASLSPEGVPFPIFALPENSNLAPFQETLIRILDTDVTFVGFEQPSYTVNENAGTLEVCVILRGASVALDLLILLQPTEGTADVVDFQKIPAPIFVISDISSNRTCSRLVILQDNLYEDTEFFNVTLSPVQMETGVHIAEPFAQIFILDESELTIGFLNNLYYTNEADGFATVNFGIIEGYIAESSLSVSVQLFFSDISAEAGSDYLEVHPEVFVFDSSTSTHTAMVPIIDDDTFELAERFQANLEFYNGSTVSRVTLGPSASITILDNFVFGFDPDTYTVRENSSTQAFIVRQISGDNGAFQFILNAATDDHNAEATAVADLDYRSSKGQLTAPISFEQSSAGFLVEIIDDNLTEMNTCFDVVLTEVFINDSIQVLLMPAQFNPGRAHVTIIDDDVAVVGFSSTSYIFLESEGGVSFSIDVLQGNIAFNLSVLLTFYNGSAVSGEDYEAVNEEYIITGSGSVTVSVNLIDDFFREETESFCGMLSFRSEETFHNIIISPNRTEIIIQDDNDTIAPTMTVEPAPQSVVSEKSTSETIATTTTEMIEKQASSHTPAETGIPATPTVQATTSSSIDALILSIVFGIIGLAIVLTGMIVILLCVRYKRKRKLDSSFDVAASKKSEKSKKEEGDLEMYIDDNEIQSGSLKHFTVQSSYKLKLPRSLMIPSCRLKLDATLGQGEFGMVYKGYIKRGYSDAITDTVAVKTLKGFVQKESVHNLLRECGKMYTFDHPNVLSLTGVCMDGGPAPYIIMPFMANGSLKEYLLKERSNFLLDPSSTEPEYSVTVEKRLLDMCDQVAKGMEYLASKRVIHRDLAARNCMLDVTNVIKVADFGLAESLDSSKDYFRQDQENTVKLPIKWLALESIHDGIFSEKSDVWSFGVTCWEIFNGGKTPYPGIHPTDIPKQLDEGMRLEKPKNAAVTDEIYSIMLKCWDSHSYLRPTFAELVKELSDLLGGMAGYLDLEATEVLDTKL